LTSSSTGPDTLDYHYSYRFMAPDNNNYKVSWVNFNMEKLEKYS